MEQVGELIVKTRDIDANALKRLLMHAVDYVDDQQQGNGFAVAHDLLKRRKEEQKNKKLNE